MDKEDRQEIERIESIIKTALLSEFDYVRKSKREEEEACPSIDFSSKEQRQSITRIKALLWRTFKLSDIRKWTDKSESDDMLILEVLDRMAKAGRLKFLQIQYLRSMKAGDVLFHIELGQGWSSFSPTDRKSEVVRLYSNDPLKKSERDECILNIKAGVESIWERQEKQREATYGKIDLSLESRVHREKVMADYELGAAQIRTAQALEEKKDEKKLL